MSISPERLIAYADGLLSPEEAHEIEQALATDPAAAAQAAHWRQQAAVMRRALAPMLDEPVPERLLKAAQTPVPAAILPFRLRARAPASWTTSGLAAAAALVVGLGLGLALRPEPGLMASGPDGGLLARGALASALASAPSGGDEAVRIVLTAPTAQGHCRVFTAPGQSGLACVESAPGGADQGWADRDWRIVALAETAGGPEAQGPYRTASGPDAAILEALDARRTGDPLDAASEHALIAGTTR